MKNMITIKNKERNYKLEADNYLAIGLTGERLDMMTNLSPKELIIMLIPLLEELDEMVKKSSYS